MNEILTELWNKIKLVFSEMWPVIWPSIKVVLTESGRYTLQTAINVVKKVQEDMPAATGAEKAAAAFAQISAILIAQGFKVANSVIKICIEYAYNEMMAEPEVIEEAKLITEMMAQQVAEPVVPEWVK